MSEERFAGVTHYTHVDVQPGGINIQHVEHLHQTDVLQALGIELEMKQKSKPKTKVELEAATMASLQADVLWQRLCEGGMIDADCQPTVSRTEAAVIADVLAERIGLTNKWKFFEQLWHRNNMRNDYNTALCQRKTLEFRDKLKNLLD